MKRDIKRLVAAADDALLRVDNPLHRRILENYRLHAIFEVAGSWEQIFTPDMTVEHPIYNVEGPNGRMTLEGHDAVTGFYRQLVDLGMNVMAVEDEELAVADWGFASQYRVHVYLRGSALPDGDPDKFYVQSRLICMHWPYDEHGRMIGETVYEDPRETTVVEVPENEFITPAEARAQLLPLVRPLPVLV
ncbi:hypothetical protein WCD74_22280 [Actinomycetospora sp. OC33-EN08]|uniref:SnoaL-like domain-containing protein n=1 Tax=Actinomycetospora aurantiaca TaxID=3129233 RepID=A0ABU8MT86_9PSEU